MKIVSTSSPQLGPNRAPQIEARLAKGEVPADLFLGSTPLNAHEAARAGTRQVAGRLLPAGVLLSGVGASMGFALAAARLLPGPYLVGGTALGAAVGMAITWDIHYHLKGEVRVERDGQAEVRGWKGSPDLQPLQAPEVETLLKANGTLGDHIEPAQGGTPGPEQPELAELARQHKDQLKTWAGQHRLLADLGAHSAYGQPALQLVDASQARSVLAEGKPLFAARASAQDQTHELRTTATTGTRNEVTVRYAQYTERAVDYTLQPLKSEADFAAVAEGPGLPAGLLGVYRDGQHYSEVVGRQNEAGERRFLDKEELRSTFSNRTGREGASFGQSGIESRLDQLSRNSTKPAVIATGILGATTAAMLGFEPVLGAAVGAAAGQVLGRLSIASEPGSRTRGAIRTGMMLTGALAGGAAALHCALQPAGGEHALLGALGLGAWGGLSAGAYTGYRTNCKEPTVVGELGLIGGFVVGGLAQFTHNPLAAAALVGLGAAGGALMGRIAGGNR